MKPAVLLLACSALFAACGGGDDAPSAEDELPAGHDDVVVIEDWVETLSSGDVDGAAEFFALPSIAQNGTPPLQIETREDAIAFNESLPCGAELIRARPDGPYIAATFRLTERPGGSCGPGVGGLARTAFVIEDGKIVQWRRLSDAATPPPTGPVV